MQVLFLEILMDLKIRASSHIVPGLNKKCLKEIFKCKKNISVGHLNIGIVNIEIWQLDPFSL